MWHRAKYLAAVCLYFPVAQAVSPDQFWDDIVSVAKAIHLSIPAAPGVLGNPAQELNKLIATKIVMYCWEKGDATSRACEMQQSAAYNRLIDGNEFPRSTRGVIMACARVDNYLYVEECMAEMTPYLPRP